LEMIDVRGVFHKIKEERLSETWRGTKANFACRHDFKKKKIGWEGTNIFYILRRGKGNSGELSIFLIPRNTTAKKYTTYYGATQQLEAKKGAHCTLTTDRHGVR